jgi:2,4-dienoyl-CoA reductase-like NADH-dependent reductase (Old Yellow Enzyme family)
MTWTPTSAATVPQPTAPSSSRSWTATLLQEVIEEVRERWGDGVVVLARDDDDAVGRNNQVGDPLERLRCFTRGILLVHLVEEGQAVLERIDEGHVVPARAALVHDETRGADSLPTGANGAVEDDEPKRHEHLPSRAHETTLRVANGAPS